jgi:hypothetical protein
MVKEMYALQQDSFIGCFRDKLMAFKTNNSL